MAAPNLATNIDASYADSGTDASVKTHQENHDEVHKVVNLFDDATPATPNTAPVWNGSLFVAGYPDPRRRDVSYNSVTVTGATTTLDLSLGVVQFVTFGAVATTTLTPTNLVAGEVNWLELVIKQDATGGRTVTWWSNIKWAGGTVPTLTTTGSGVDRFMLTTYNGTNWFGDIVGQAYA